MRNDFTTAGNLKVMDILLDTKNYRLGEMGSQADCIDVMFDRIGEQIKELALDISKHGLGIEHIVVAKSDDKFTVYEGNRRILALKALNNPNIVPEKFRAYFQSLKENAVVPIPDEVECITGTPQSIRRHVELRHLGMQGGAGLMTWGTYEQENYRNDQGKKPSYPQAINLLAYLESKNIAPKSKVPLTNIQRFIQNQDVIDAIQLRWDNETPKFSHPPIAHAVLKEFLADFAGRGKTVKDIYDAGKIHDYLTELLSRPVVKQAENDVQQHQHNAVQASEQALSKPNTRLVTGCSPIKASYDRPCLFPRKKISFSPPHSEAKINNILAEIKELDVRKTPIAVGVLLRAVIEFSVDHYIEAKKIRCEKDELHNKIRLAAISMEQCGLISKKKCRVLENSRDHETLLPSPMLNAWVHSKDTIPIPQSLCILWENISFFIENCWK